ncbi:OsmC family protein [Cellvibrio mixtus]|uniref:OsmC family protein n=1 Tax=Cellvibrio mixtus TaxID=39650 RepID=UPI0005870A8C|nr:OsmC family protein [Cellvibrio mixtus]
MVHKYTAEVIWERGDQVFSDNKYSRKHVLKFDGGIEVQGSSSPFVVPLPYSVENAIDPEEAFVSSLSSCHMLWFLSIAVKQGFVVDSYHDNAIGIMTMNERKKLWVSEVTLNPLVVFSGEKTPTPEGIVRMHDEAHEECFIANSVKSTVRIISR